MCPGIGIHAASAFFIQFREESKATSQHLSSIGGKYSLAKISESERKAALVKRRATVFWNQFMLHQH